jgi:tRNA-intron endonuclease
MVWDAETSAFLHKEGFFGRLMDEGNLQLSLVESCYLLNRGVLEIQKNRDNMDVAGFSGIACNIESDFMIKYTVYEQLRDSGLVPKTGFKFGTHFRVYDDFESVSSLSHSVYLVHAVERNHVFSLQRLSRAVRLANSVRKEMIYGDGTGFFVIGRVRL